MREDRRLRELAFLHEIAQLATLARDWDELMRSIVDGTTVAMAVEVCSFYLADHEKTRLTLAATNGLDRTQVGRVSLAWGAGITGRVAATRSPIAVVDVTKDDRFSWVRGFDIEGLTAMLSVPLIWHDGVVGVLNVQTRDARRFDDGEIAFLQTIGALLAGIVEKGRLTAEVEARLAELTALDAARAELLSVVTHELRTPLSVVRVYVDLLAEAAAAAGAGDHDDWHDSATEQLGRLDRLVDSILASVRGEGLTGLSRAPFDAVGAVDETVETLRLLLRPRPIRWERPAGPLTAVGDETRFRQVLEQLLENESKYAPSAEGVSIGIWRIADEVQVYVTDDGPGVPIEDWESVFEPFVRIEGRGRSRGSGIGLFAGRRLMNAMGGRIFIEANGFGGSRFGWLTLRSGATIRFMTAAAATDGIASWRLGEIWRDIARGGLAGLIVGLFVAGIGGRLAMRLATLLEPEATGSFTENAAEIGVISLGGTFSVLTIGILAGAAAGVLWVIVRTWLPGAGIRRALVTAVVSIAFGSFLLVRGANSDFVILDFNPVVVGALVLLVGAVGFFISMVDGWLDRRLPVARSVRSPATSVYAAIALVGGLLILPLVVITFLGLSADEGVVRRAPLRPVGIGFFVLGAATLRWWFLRLRGADRPPRSLLLFGRAALAVTVLLGVLIELPEIRTALGIY